MAAKANPFHVDWRPEFLRQNDLIDSMVSSAKDRRALWKLLTRIDNHYRNLLESKEKDIARLAAAEATMAVRLEVLEKVHLAQETKLTVDQRALQRVASQQSARLSSAAEETGRMRAAVRTVQATIHASVLTIGAELAIAENAEHELRQVLGFVRKANEGKQQRSPRGRLARHPAWDSLRATPSLPQDRPPYEESCPLGAAKRVLDAHGQ